MEFALLVLVAFIVAASAVAVTNALNQVRSSYDRVHEAELSMRTHLQAQVDDLHAKVLSTNWSEYANTVSHRSAFDRAIDAEAQRIQTKDLTAEDMRRQYEESDVFDPMEGVPTIG